MRIDSLRKEFYLVSRKGKKQGIFFSVSHTMYHRCGGRFMVDLKSRYKGCSVCKKVIPQNILWDIFEVLLADYINTYK